MGLILDAMGYGAGAGGDILADQRKSDLQAARRNALSSDTEQRQMRLAEHNSKLDLERTRAIEALKAAGRPQALADKSEAADAARQRRADELRRARGDAVDNAITSKASALYGNGSALDHGDLAPEELAAPELQLSDAEKQAAFKQAGIDTGQIDAKTALSDDARIAARERTSRRERVKDKAATMKSDVATPRVGAADRDGAEAVAIHAVPPKDGKAITSIARKLGIGIGDVGSTLDLLKEQAVAGNQTAVRRLLDIADEVKAMSADPVDAAAATQSPTEAAGITPVVSGDAGTGMTAGMRRPSLTTSMSAGVAALS